MQVLQIDKSHRGARKSGRWSRAPRHRAVGPGVAAVLAGVIGLAALAATLLAGRTGDGQRVTIPAAMTLDAALEQGLSTTESHVGEAVTLQTREPLRISEEFTLPAGIIIRGQVLRITSDSGGVPELAVGFTDLEIAGERYSIAAQPFRIRHSGPAAGPKPAEGIVLPAGQRIHVVLSEPISVRFNGSRTNQGS